MEKLKEMFSKRSTKIILIVVCSVLVLALGIVLFFVLKPCNHQWQDATCSQPKTCLLCGEVEGATLKHTWKDATCETAVTCEVCGEVAGKALGHQWKDATCKTPQTCTVCDKTKGEPLEHQWSKATCEKPQTCSVCKETKGKKAEHKWEDATYTKPKTCSVCGKTSGSVLYNPEDSVVGTYQMSYLDDFSTVTESLYFYSDGSVVHKCNVNDDDGYGSWTVSGSTISFTLFWDGSDHTNYETATIVSGGIMWGSSFLRKL